MGHNTLKKISFTGLLLYVNFISLIWKPAAAPPLGLRRNSACNPGVRLTALRAAATELQLFRRYLHFIEQLRALCHNNQASGRYWVLQRQPWLRLFFTNLTVAGGLCCLLKLKKNSNSPSFFVCLFWGWPESVKKKKTLLPMEGWVDVTLRKKKLPYSSRMSGANWGCSFSFDNHSVCD